MDRIVIEVDESVAQAFMHAGKEKQKRIGNAINDWLKKTMNAASQSRYKKMLDRISDEAAANGLTEKKLEKLLAEND